MNIPGYNKSYATLSSEEMIKLASSTKKAANAPYGYSYGDDGHLHYRQGAIGGSTAYDGEAGARLADRMQAKYRTPDTPTATPQRTKSWYDEDYRKEVAMRSPTNKRNAEIINKDYDTSTLEGRHGLAAAQALWQKQYDGAVRELMRVHGDKWRAKGFTDSQINNFVHNDVMKSLERRGIANYPGAQQQDEEPVIYTAPQTVMNRGQQQPQYNPQPKATPTAYSPYDNMSLEEISRNNEIDSQIQNPEQHLTEEPATTTAEETPTTESAATPAEETPTAGPAASTAVETPGSTTLPQDQTEYGPQPSANPMDPDSYYDYPLSESETNALFDGTDSDLETPTTEDGEAYPVNDYYAGAPVTNSEPSAPANPTATPTASPSGTVAPSASTPSSTASSGMSDGSLKGSDAETAFNNNIAAYGNISDEDKSAVKSSLDNIQQLLEANKDTVLDVLKANYNALDPTGDITQQLIDLDREAVSMGYRPADILNEFISRCKVNMPSGY